MQSLKSILVLVVKKCCETSSWVQSIKNLLEAKAPTSSRMRKRKEEKAMQKEGAIEQEKKK